MENQFKCVWDSEDINTMVLIESSIFNKIEYVRYNSSVGKYVGFTDYGIRKAENWNNDKTLLEERLEQVNILCKFYAGLFSIYNKGPSVKPQVKVRLVRPLVDSHPAMLMCSVYNFYPKRIKVTWLRNGKEIPGDLTSTELLADGDWYYQIHVYLEYLPQSREEVICVVEHASFKKPMLYKYDSFVSEPERTKMTVGGLGLVFGIISAVTGFIFYKIKSSQQMHEDRESVDTESL